jgi:nicotinate phosphoribosyltransferase
MAISLYRKFAYTINVSFGIGTNLTNDCGFEAPQIVIKNTETNGLPTAKISDSRGKGMCKDKEFESYLRKVIKEKIKTN